MSEDDTMPVGPRGRAPKRRRPRTVTCRLMETRTCPPTGPCAGPCARFESDDPTPWQGDTTMSDADARAWSERTAARWRAQEADTTMSEDDTTIPNHGIGDDVRLIIDTDAGRVLDMTLIMAALKTRAHRSWEITPFLYRDPYDPDEPDAPRPLRRAVLAIVDDKVVPKGLLGAEGAEGSEPEWSAWNDPNNP